MIGSDTLASEFLPGRMRLPGLICSAQLWHCFGLADLVRFRGASGCSPFEFVPVDRASIGKTVDNGLSNCDGMLRSEHARVIVFDFDLTLTRWDTASRFFKWLLRRDLWRLALVLLALPVLAPLLLVKVTRKWPIRYVVWVATLGRTNDALPALVEEHIQSLPMGHASVFLPDAVAQPQAHVEQGDQVVIATGCLQPLAVRCCSTPDWVRRRWWHPRFVLSLAGWCGISIVSVPTKFPCFLRGDSRRRGLSHTRITKRICRYFSSALSVIWLAPKPLV